MSSGGPFVQPNGNIFAILVDGILRNNDLNFLRMWASDLEDIVLKILSGALVALLFSGAEPFIQLTPYTHFSHAL